MRSTLTKCAVSFEKIINLLCRPHYLDTVIRNTVYKNRSFVCGGVSGSTELDPLALSVSSVRILCAPPRIKKAELFPSTVRELDVGFLISGEYEVCIFIVQKLKEVFADNVILGPVSGIPEGNVFREENFFCTNRYCHGTNHNQRQND